MAGDPFYNNVSLLLHGNGTDGSTTFTDNSPSPKTVTPVGNAQISTAQSKFGGASMLFDGFGDYLTTPNHADFNFGSGDFTIECFFRTTVTDIGVNQIIAYKRTAGVFYAPFYFFVGTDNAVNFYGSATGSSWLYTITTPSANKILINTWYHLAAVRNGNTFTVYINGVNRGSTNAGASSLTVNTDPLLVSTNGTGSGYITGNLDELRITKGVARYTANFTPPTAQFEDSLPPLAVEISGSILAETASASGSVLAGKVASGPIGSQPVSVSGQLAAVRALSGTSQAQPASVSGVIVWGSDVSGNVIASPSTASGQLAVSRSIQGSAQANPSSLSALAHVTKLVQGSLQSNPSAISGSAFVPSVVTGNLQSPASSVAGSLDSFTSGTLLLAITQDIISSNDTLSFRITQDIYSYGTLTATIESNITGYTSGTLSLSITQNISSGSGTLSLQITQSIVPPITPVVAGSGRWWTAKMYLDSVDVSISLTGTITVDAEVNAARVATFTLKPTAGVVSPFSWVNKPVRIDYQETDSSGTVQATYTLFNGVVDTPNYNPTTRLTTFDCTDGMQKKFEAMSKPVIAGIIPGYWHESVFDKDTDSWSYALDLLSTIPYDMDINVIGNIILTPWLAKTTADYTFGMGNILDGSLSVSLANSRDLINDYEVSFDYRYELYRERGVRYSWHMDPGVMSADFVVYSPDMPFGQAFIDAIESAGLTFTEAPHLTPLPVSGNYLVYGLSGGAQTILWGNDNPDGIMAAQGNCSIRYSQTITEKRVSHVYSPQSVGQLSSIKSTLSASVEADYGDALQGYDETVEMQESHANNANAVAVSSSGNVIPYTIGGSVTTTYNGYANDYSALATTLDRETVYDFSSLMVSGDRPDADAAAEVLLNVASTDILNSHRRNTVSFTTLLCPYLDRIHTVRVDTDTVTAKGKVRQIVHSMDIDTGSALTECSLAISLASAVGIPPTPPTLVPPAEGDVEPATITDYDSVVSLPTYVAGLSGPFDEDMTGWIAQSDVASEGYSNSFVVPFDGVDEANLQEQEIPYEDEFEVIIPVDELLLEA